ncbi:MAG: hypothetical protein IT173_07950 [Acidobacteria bacterium]|nr:hypothetical protein [Acidobacteriota bacterium]
MALPRNAVVNIRNAALRHDRQRTFWTAVLLGSGMLSILAFLGGFMCSAAPWFLDDNIESRTGLGTGLLIAFFQLLFLVGHSLDKINEAETAIRVERCRQTGMAGAPDPRMEKK